MNYNFFALICAMLFTGSAFATDFMYCNVTPGSGGQPLKLKHWVQISANTKNMGACKVNVVDKSVDYYNAKNQLDNASNVTREGNNLAMYNAVVWISKANAGNNMCEYMTIDRSESKDGKDVVQSFSYLCSLSSKESVTTKN